MHAGMAPVQQVPVWQSHAHTDHGLQAHCASHAVGAVYERLFGEAVAQLTSLGGTQVDIDFTPFAETAALLYESSFVAERYAGIRAFLERANGTANGLPADHSKTRVGAQSPAQHALLCMGPDHATSPRCRASASCLLSALRNSMLKLLIWQLHGHLGVEGLGLSL